MVKVYRVRSISLNEFKKPSQTMGMSIFNKLLSRDENRLVYTIHDTAKNIPSALERLLNCLLGTLLVHSIDDNNTV